MPNVSGPRILICGYFGFGNVGDEAILAATLTSYRERNPDASFAVLSGDPSRTDALHSVEGIPWRRPERLIDAVKRADLVVVGGGGLFHDYWGTDGSGLLTRRDWGITFFTSPAFVGALEGKPVVLSGVGVGPLRHEESRRFVRSACEVASSITVRDPESMDLLKEIGVPDARIAVTADPAFLLAPAEPSRGGRPGSPTIGVALREWKIGIAEGWERQVAEALDVVSEEIGGNVVFLPFQALEGDLEDDVALAARVRSSMIGSSRTRIDAPSDPREALRRIGECDLLLGMRLHSLIMAAGLRIPMVAIDYDAKVGALMRRLDLPDYVIPAEDVDASRVSAALLDARQNSSRIVAVLDRRVPEQKRAASRNTEIALAALGGKRNETFSAETQGVLDIVEERMRQERDEGGEPPSSSAGEGDAVPGALATRPTGPYSVLVLPIISWDFRFQRPQQLATQFARHGHRVFYLSLTGFLPPGGAAWELRGRSPGVGELQLRSRRTPDVYSGRLEVADVDALEESIRTFMNDQKVEHFVSVVQIPFWTSLALRLRGRFDAPILYDCMDEWTNFPGITSDVLGFEPSLVREADVTSVSSRRLAEKWEPTARRLVLARNGVDLAHYVARYGPGKALADVPRPIIGYFGALASWVDVELLEKIAVRFPAATLVLVGGRFDLDLSRLDTLPNVRILDQRPYAEIPQILWRFDVCLIPFLVNAITEATDPVKFYEYCFSGKPVVATDLPELRRFAGLCLLAVDHEEFLALTARALEESADDPIRVRRRDIAAANDWERRYRQIDAAVREVEKEYQVSIARATVDDVERRLAEVPRLRAEIAGLRAESDLSRAEIQRLRDGLEAEREELARIHESRLWKIASVYWSLRTAFRRNPGGLPSPGSDERSARPTEGDRSIPTAEVAETVLAPMPEPARYDVLCFPIVDWDFRFQRPQQLMSQFAEAGHRVFYFSLTFRRTGPPWTLAVKRPNVYEISLRGPSVNAYRKPLKGPDRDLLFASVDALRRDLAIDLAAICVQLPFWWPLARRLADAMGWPFFYDCMDHHAGFSTNQRAMLEQEEELVHASPLVVVSSRFLEREFLPRNENVLLVRNACEYDHFQGFASPPRIGRRPVIGYYGAIADWFDSDLVADVAERRPDWDFVLVGSTFSADLRRLARLSNVSLPGEKPYSEIPEWLAKFDVAMIPFRRTPLTEATNPVKAYEILAAGKPLVAVPLPEVAELGPLVRLAATASEFEKQIEGALSDDGSDVPARRRFARENTWEERFRALAPAVASLFTRTSVIVVTFGNRDINRSCLESLFGRTAWPNLEVIVVDNASTDGTREFLRAAEREYPGLRVILNDRNLGFAAANNEGLREATGDVLVLLNNDTIVSRGWLSALIRHLKRDRQIGLIGAVTNAIGNEAMIPVGYEGVDDMPGWAARYVREHAGETFEIPMLAMFCVAMRRDVYERVGPLDERFGVGMFEDDDYARRVREAGLRIVCARDSFVHHWMKASFKNMPQEEYDRLFDTNRRMYEEKWGIPWTPHRSDLAGPEPPVPNARSEG